jgi:hypothetical protein
MTLGGKPTAVNKYSALPLDGTDSARSKLKGITIYKGQSTEKEGKEGNKNFEIDI